MEETVKRRPSESKWVEEGQESMKHRRRPDSLPFPDRFEISSNRRISSNFVKSRVRQERPVPLAMARKTRFGGRHNDWLSDGKTEENWPEWARRVPENALMCPCSAPGSAPPYRLSFRYHPCVHLWYIGVLTKFNRPGKCRKGPFF